MRQLIINQILNVIRCNGGGTPAPVDYHIAMDSMRWHVVSNTYFQMVDPTYDTATKSHRKLLVTWQLTAEMLDKLTDEQLVQLFQNVVWRASRQM